MPTLLLVRHAQASFGAEDYDVLSERGRRQSEVIAQRIAALDGVTRVVCGRLARQRDTATAIAAMLGPHPGIPAPGPDIVEDGAWDEYDHEDLLTVAARDPAFADRFAALGDAEDRARAFQDVLDVALRRWMGGGDGYRESWEAFVDRARRATDALLADLDRSETAVVVTSGGIVAAVCASVLEFGPEPWLRLNRVMVNTSVTRVIAGRRGTSVVAINDHAHLEGQPAELLTYR